MKHIIVLAIAATALTACNAANRPGRGELFMSEADVAAKDDAICRGYGAEPGTPEYVQCRGTQDQRRDAAQAPRRSG
ncbi:MULTISPECIES: hypothetical protein [Methylobacterium]|jgi:hypothetical protein|uniref:hypothetical protein n=1 Tax=Methylobacterium TaxID=407 RepID=UPI0003694E70|nr:MULTISPECIES: hypothetical protein [Methylobacterium]KQS79889.1 hypothetical protein ASG32_24855 [Methylobacterium sp. Leaf361]MBN4094759.1 hypothetical protein [Methylobacterium sp. OT2]UIN32854.1 hypothetical protein LXM90_17330 [Methylobacterium oryzae]SEG65709.1 hypothetical protein SAMN04488144_13437 [Methylobacterium sp. 190mf]SEI14238.1 hypothetical protein SAMN02799636_05921 [Methylobacterium sp. 275MFSha3.1]